MLAGLISTMGKPFLSMATSSATPATSLWACVGRSFRCVPAPLEVKVGGMKLGVSHTHYEMGFYRHQEGDWVLAENTGFGKSPGMDLSLSQQNHLSLLRLGSPSEQWQAIDYREIMTRVSYGT